MEGDHTTSLAYLIPCMIVLVDQKILFTYSLNLSFQHMLNVSLSVSYQCDESGSASQKTSLKILEHCCWVPPNLHLLKAKQASLPQSFLTESGLHLQLLWCPLRISSSLYQREPVLQMWYTA